MQQTQEAPTVARIGPADPSLASLLGAGEVPMPAYIPVFTSASGEALLMQAYGAVMTSWLVPSKELTTTTSLGPGHAFTGASPSLAFIPALASSLFAEPQIAWLLLVLGPLLFVISLRQWRSRVARLRAAILAITITIAGLVLVLGPFAATRSGEESRNPVTADSRSIEAGRASYQRHCVDCHGPTGHGDGPLAGSFSPRPSDLTVHVPLLPDRFVFAKISDGVSGTAMPAWKGQLSDREIWDVVNYLRTLNR